MSPARLWRHPTTNTGVVPAGPLFRHVTLWSGTMPRPSVGETPMTGAERQARYRAAPPPARRSFARGALLIAVAEFNDGMTLSPASLDCRSSIAIGWRRYPIISKTAQRPRPCVRLSNSISPTSRRSNHREGSAVIEQWDGQAILRRDDARKRMAGPSRLTGGAPHRCETKRAV